VTSETSGVRALVYAVSSTFKLSLFNLLAARLVLIVELDSAEAAVVLRNVLPVDPLVTASFAAALASKRVPPDASDVPTKLSLTSIALRLTTATFQVSLRSPRRPV